MQDKGFNSFISNMTNLLSVNETKWSSLLARTRALILYISIWMCVFGPEKLPGLWRNGPLGRIKRKQTPIPQKRQAARRPRRAIFPFLIWWKKDLLILRLFFPRLGTRDAKRQTYQACPSFKGLGLLNYRIQGTFSRYVLWGGSVARQSHRAH